MSTARLSHGDTVRQRGSTAAADPPRAAAPAQPSTSDASETSAALDSSSIQWRTLLAGACSGTVEASLLFPAENVKTQLQLPRAPPFTGPLDCARQTLATHGIRGFYSGVSAAVVGSVLKAGTRFYAFDVFKSLLAHSPARAPGARTGTTAVAAAAATRATVKSEASAVAASAAATAPRIALAGLFAGAAEAIIAVTPSECLKTRLLQDRLSTAPRHTSAAALAAAILCEEGPRGLYRGLVPTVARQAANQAVRFTVFYGVIGVVQRRADAAPVTTAAQAVTTAAAACAGTTAAALGEQMPKAGAVPRTGHDSSDSGGNGSSGSKAAPAAVALDGGVMLAAGALAGAASVYATMPIDVIKVSQAAFRAPEKPSHV
jgi:hypothetical protein